MLSRLTAAALALATIGAAAAFAGAPVAPAQDDRTQTTQLISRAADGGVPNGPSTNAVISNDRRYARVIAFESEASDLVGGDTNGLKDVFMVRRSGSANNKGTPWRGGAAILLSRGAGGAPANGPSFSPTVDGSFRKAPRCVAFLSAASNLVAGDTNGKVDAFLSSGPGRSLTRVSLPSGRQAKADTTHVAVSGDCSRIAYVVAGQIYVRSGRRSKALRSRGAAADPSFATGQTNDLVYGDRGGVYLAAKGTGRPRRVAVGGRNPVYNSIKRRVVAYEKTRGGRTQIAWRDLGRRERLASGRGGRGGDGDSRNPVIGNSGFYIAFESDARNLGLDAGGSLGDRNGAPDVYLFTDARDITLVQSVEEKGVPLPGGGMRPSMSFYANYIVFDSPAPLGGTGGARQVFMRYLGGI